MAACITAASSWQVNGNVRVSERNFEPSMYRYFCLTQSRYLCYGESKSDSPPLSLLRLTISKTDSTQLSLSLGNDHTSGSVPLYSLRLTEIKSGSRAAICITVERNQERLITAISPHTMRYAISP